MSESLEKIRAQQVVWAADQNRDPDRADYVRTVEDNLFLGRLSEAAEEEFRSADGNELRESGRRPAKMRSTLSSSALAVNFFDAWRSHDLGILRDALGLEAIADLRFEYKPSRYPVGPRSPNLDLLITTCDGSSWGVECKFTEPFRSKSGGPFSPKYFPSGRELWVDVGLARAQELAKTLRPHWRFIDAGQLLKHLLGLAADDRPSVGLLYLWYDTGLDDARGHREEVERFASAVSGDDLAFKALTYQEVFAALQPEWGPGRKWHRYMKHRYVL